MPFANGSRLTGSLLIWTVALLWPPDAVVAEAASEKPNIVFIMVDDMGYADIGMYGQDAYPTPNLDRMAHEGLRFTQAYSGCTVCAPARSTLMTGTHMGHTLVRGNSGGIPLPDRAVTIAEILRGAGYATGGFGKWGLGDIRTEGAAEKQGFDTFFGYYDQVHAHNYFPDYLILDGKHYPLPGNQQGTPAERRFSHYLIFERMQQFIREHHDEPFFCYAPWTPPHARYQLPPDDPAWQMVEDRPWNKRTKGHAAFNMMVDRHVGETLALLKELGIDRETIVFFCSDNGASHRFEGTLDSSGPLTGFKRSLHEGGLRVPFLVRFPGRIEPGQITDLPIYFPDVLPTLAELAGAESRVPKSVDGLSFAPTLFGDGEQPRHEFLYWEWRRGTWRAVRQGDWKLLREGANQPWELYNLADDRGEQHNLAQENPRVVKRLVRIAEEAHEPAPPQKEPSSEGPFR